MFVCLDVKSLYPHLKVNWNVLMCKICIAWRLVVDIFPWCNVNFVPFPSGMLVACRMWNGSIVCVNSVNFHVAECSTRLINIYVSFPGGATRMARGGIRLVHGLTKSTLITYYSGMKKDPIYVFLHAFFLICLSYSFQNLSIWPKTHPFFQFCTFLHP